MSETGTDPLPAVRIQCHKGRIRVGGRNFLSASQALTVYLQQFDRRLQQPQHALQVWTALNASGVRDDSFGCSASDVSASLGMSRCDLAPVLAVHGPLTPGLGALNASGGGVYSPVNGDVLPQRDWGPYAQASRCDHQGTPFPQLHRTSLDAACAPEASPQSLPPVNGLRRHNSLSSLWEPHLSGPELQHQPYDTGYSSYASPTPKARPAGYLNTHASFRQSDILSDCGPRYENGHSSNENGVMDYLDFHCFAAGGEDSADGKDTGLLLTNMPSQRELKALTEDVLREVRMKRLKKTPMPSPAASPEHSTASHVQEVPCRGPGEASKTEASSRDRGRMPRGAGRDPTPPPPSTTCPEEPTPLQQEVDEALSRSQELLDNLKKGKVLQRPQLSQHVSGRHSADILLASTTSTSHNHQSSAPSPSTRPGRSPHRYSYRAQDPSSPVLRARSLSLDGRRPVHRPETVASVDDASVLLGSRAGTRSLAHSRQFRSLENLSPFPVSDVRPPRSYESLKPFPVADATVAKSRPPAESLNPLASCAERREVGGKQRASVSAFSHDACQQLSTADQGVPIAGLNGQLSPPEKLVDPTPKRLETYQLPPVQDATHPHLGFKRHERSPVNNVMFPPTDLTAHELNSVNELMAPPTDLTTQPTQAEDLLPARTGPSDRELQYLKRGTSVLSDCEDLLRQLQAVNPPALPDISFYKQSWGEQRRSREAKKACSARTDNTDFTHAGMDDNHCLNSSGEFSYPDLTLAWKGKPFSGLNGLRPPSVVVPMTDDRVTTAGLNGSVPTVNSLTSDASDTTLDASSFVEFSYTGPGLSFSDLTISASPGTTEHAPKSAKSGPADLPPKCPQRPTRNRSHSETRTASKRTVTNPSNPVLRGVADILDSIDQDTDTTHTSQLPEDPGTQSPVNGLAAALRGSRDGLEGNGPSPHELAAQDNVKPNRNEDRGRHREGLRTRSQSLPPSKGHHSSLNLNDSRDHTAQNGELGVRKDASVQEEKDRDEGAELLPALKGFQYELQPGGESLEKALVHLGRLKSLVQAAPMASQATTSTSTASTSTT